MNFRHNLLEKAYWIAGIVVAVVAVVGVIKTYSTQDSATVEIVQKAGEYSTQIGNVTDGGTVIVNQKKDIKDEIPAIVEQPYSVARALLIRDGWIPQINHWSYANNDGIQSGNGPVFWKKGYHELDYCSGTGYALCRFEFNDAKGNLLVVITAGEAFEENNFDASVFRVYLNPKNEEGAYVETLGAFSSHTGLSNDNQTK